MTYQETVLRIQLSVVLDIVRGKPTELSFLAIYQDDPLF